MIVRESYSERRDGTTLTLDYTASFIPDAATVRQFLQSAGLLFTVVTPQGEIVGPLHREEITLEGAPGGNAQATARIRYVQRASDLLSPAAPILIEPAPPASGSVSPAPAAGAVALPLLSHHWTLRVTKASTAPAAELRCVGTCDGLPSTRAALLAGLQSSAAAVPTPQFGILDGMVKDEVAFEPGGADGTLRVRLVWRSLSLPGAEEFPQVEIVATTGRKPGSCTLTKASREEPPSLSQTLGQLLSYQGLFAGRVANIDRFVSAGGLFTASVTALDARWDMAGIPVGSVPPNAAGAESYARRGYEWVFNRGGRPDMDAASGGFGGGDTATYWSYGAILAHLAAAYLPPSITAQPGWTGLDNADQVPGEIDLRGRDLATAVDLLLAQMGYTWTLRYDASTGATLHAFREADGSIAVPVGTITQATGAAHAGKAETIQDAWSQTEVLSAPALCQCGFASQPGGPFSGFVPLAQEAAGDADFAYLYRPDFSSIATRFPFLDNRSGAGYPLHLELAVRTGVDGYSYAPARLSRAVAAPAPGIAGAHLFWATWNDLNGEWRRVAGGIALRSSPGAVLVRRRITVHSHGASQDRPKVEQVRPLDHAGFRIAGTLAFVSDYRLSSSTGDDGSLPLPRRRTVTQPEIVPAYTCAWVGDDFDPDDLNGYAVNAGLTTLVDVQAQLDALAQAAQAGQAAERVQSSALLDYWPGGSGGLVGKTLSFGGSFLTGPEGIVTGMTLRRGATDTCLLRATNQPLSGGQGRLAEAAAARRHFLSLLPPSL